MEWKHVHGLILFLLVFFAIDLLLNVLALYGYNGFFATVRQGGGTIDVHGSDILVFILSVPVALLLHIWWYKGKWSWFSRTSKIHRNVFYIFLLLYLVLFFAMLFGGSHACASACSAGVQSCTVNYRPFGVQIVYACRSLISP